jgi:hypothetical protein
MRAASPRRAELLADCDILRGRIWVFGLVAIAVAPYLSARWREIL